MNEWNDEPDRKHWIDETTGLDCLIVRNNINAKGALCGYVGVSRSHPWFGKNYREIEGEVDVHGGLTFANSCRGKICHDENGEKVANKEVWWLGFDCAHSGDLIPRQTEFRKFGYTYKNIAYVEAECKKLAAQIEAAK